MKNSIQMISVIALILVFLLSSSVWAGKNDLLDLYSLAKVKDPSIGKAQALFNVSEADMNIAMAQMRPRADANASINWISHTTLNYAPGNLQGSYIGDSYGISVRQPIFQLQNVYSLDAARASVRGAEATLTGSRQDLIIRLTEAYFGLLKTQADEALYRNELKRLGQIFGQAQEFLKAGTGDIIAVYEAKARMDSAAADLVKAGSQRRLAAQQLSNIVGVEIAEVMDLGLYEPRGPEPADVQWWLDTMQKQRPSIIQAREILTQAEFQRKAAKAGHLPALQASGGYSVSKGSTFLPEVETRQWYIGLSLSIPLYSGGETTARTRRAVAVESEQNFILNETREQSIQKLKEVFLSLQYSTSLITALKQKKISADGKLEAVKKGRTIGTRTAIELLNAEHEYASAQRDFASALYDNALRNLQLKSAAGILTESDLTALNSLLTE